MQRPSAGPKRCVLAGKPACKALKQVTGTKGAARDWQLVWGEENWGEKGFFSPSWKR